MPDNGQASDQIKLSCRNLWKVYGKDAASFFTGTDAPGDTAALARRIRETGHIVAACDVSFDVRVGEIFVIMGLSGSGKSTVVRCLSRLVEPTAGEVRLDGRNLLKASPDELIDIRRHKMGMVFQSFGLLPHLTVLDNVAFPLRLQGSSEGERHARARKMIELVGLKEREAAFPHQLSGGQQQRVGIARSLAVDPELWFLDEPFSALDPLIRRQMQDEFLRLQQLLRKSIVFITHDFLEALRIADRMAIMRDGRIVQMGAPADLVLNPADSYVAEFTSEVPRSRVLTSADAIDASLSVAADAPKIDGRVKLEDLLPELAARPAGLRVVDVAGNALGMVTPGSVIAVLADAKSQPNAA
ncbi:MAG: betaine/proline/choline family ABC transporter ATP-binding protein [Rhodospirillaceae bacterium]|nr:betaine/proline/choline family ABC transporter ATP-binding protein [Rhodospirillaceae bacterium]